MARAKKPAAVREPIQVYLDRGERADLDRLARELGVSRAEVLRRGIEEIKRKRSKSIYDLIEEWAAAGYEFKDAPANLSERLDEEAARIRDEKAAEFFRKYS